MQTLFVARLLVLRYNNKHTSQYSTSLYAMSEHTLFRQLVRAHVALRSLSTELRGRYGFDRDVWAWIACRRSRLRHQRKLFITGKTNNQLAAA